MNICDVSLLYVSEKVRSLWDLKPSKLEEVASMVNLALVRNESVHASIQHLRWVGCAFAGLRWPRMGSTFVCDDEQNIFYKLVAE